jgi:hypothetical protein
VPGEQGQESPSAVTQAEARSVVEGEDGSVVLLALLSLKRGGTWCVNDSCLIAQ